jgi:ABC-2 type transport system permease protein
MNLLRSEWRKVVTIRMWIGLAAAAVAFTAVNAGILIALSGLDVQGSPVPALDDPEALRTVYGSAASSAAFVLVLGIVSMTSEYRHQTISATLLATPRRGAVVTAKMAAAAAFSAIIGAACVLVTAAAVGIGAAAKGIGPIVAGDFAAIAGGVVLGFAVYGVLGVGFGSLVRNQIAAITAALLWVLLAESLIVAFWPDVGRWLPGGALNGVLQLEAPSGADYLPVAAAAALLLAYAAVFAGVAVRTTLRRDIT